MKSLSGKNKVVLAIGAHPDDIEFGCGATVAKLAKESAQVYIVVSTNGSRGSRLHNHQKEDLIIKRKQEQENARKILGAKEVFLLNEEDGNLIADISFKEKIVKLIRKYKPDIVITHDPSWFYVAQKEHAFINHNDHRATGMAVLDAVYPLARDLLSFPEHAEEGLEPHKVPEVLLFSTQSPNFYVDVTNFAQTKLQSILAHKSQIDEPKEVEKWMKERLSKNGKKAKCKYAESFTRLVFK